MKIFFYTILLFCFLGSCKQQQQTTNSHEKDDLLNTEKEHLSVFPFTESEIPDNKHIIKSLNSFSFELFRAVSNISDNAMISPFSIQTTLAMLYTGSLGNTRNQFIEVIGFPQQNKTTALFFQNQLNRYNENLDNFMFFSANGAWFQHQYNINPEYIKAIEHYYFATAQTLDFDKNPEQCRQIINEWISGKTKNRINNTIPKGQLSPLTRVVLANAAYFKADWQQQFDPSLNVTMPFYGTLQHTSTTFMKQSSQFRYYETREYQAVDFPYQNSPLSMMVILPTDTNGLSLVKKHFSIDRFNTIVDGFAFETVQIMLPKFTFESSFPLHETLPGMGISEAFSDNANFKIIAPNDILKTDKILHKTFIQVDEKGTEASAATVVTMVEKSLYPSGKMKIFKADHPFLFIIYDTKNRQLLFLGQLTSI
jgi:serpin B